MDFTLIIACVNCFRTQGHIYIHLSDSFLPGAWAFYFILLSYRLYAMTSGPDFAYISCPVIIPEPLLFRVGPGTMQCLFLSTWNTSSSFLVLSCLFFSACSFFELLDSAVNCLPSLRFRASVSDLGLGIILLDYLPYLATHNVLCFIPHCNGVHYYYHIYHVHVSLPERGE